MIWVQGIDVKEFGITNWGRLHIKIEAKLPLTNEERVDKEYVRDVFKKFKQHVKNFKLEQYYEDYGKNE